MKSAMPKMSICIFFLFFSICTVFSYTNSSPLQAKHSPRYWVDAAFYKINGSMTSVEVYYSISLTELSFSPDSGENLASYTFSVQVFDSKNREVKNDSIRRAIAAKSIEETKDQSRGVIDELIFPLGPGAYTLYTSLKDNQTKAFSFDSLQLVVPSFASRMQTSSIQFASSISDTQTNSVFNKGGRSVIPNPSRRYRCHNSVLPFYFEVYNLLPPDSVNNEFLCEYVITDSTGDSLIVVPAQSVKKPGTSCAKTQTLDIRGLETGRYLLSVTTTDPASGQSSTVQSYFWVDPPPPLKAATRLPMTPTDVKKYRDQIKYLAKPSELRIYDQLSPAGKEKFILNFWRSKDPTPETPENEYMQDYFSRIDYANKHFKGKDGGMNSDMGRVFIIYGQPDEIERHVMESGLKPYVIWHYFTAGGQQTFIFVDRNQAEIYTLVHSTVPEEIKNENWKSQELQ